jgi:hypothetical protein
LSSRQFEEQLVFGQKHEKAVVLVLNSRNYFTISLADISSGGAPRMFGRFGTAIVLPDFLVSKNSRSFPLELKTKAKADLTHVTGKLEHGISLRLYGQYLDFQNKTGFKLVLAINEICTGEIIARSLDNLGTPRIYAGNKMDKGGMAFFQRKEFFTFHMGEQSDCPLFRDVPLPSTLPQRELDEWLEP